MKFVEGMCAEGKMLSPEQEHHFLITDLKISFYKNLNRPIHFFS